MLHGRPLLTALLGCAGRGRNSAFDTLIGMPSECAGSLLCQRAVTAWICARHEVLVATQGFDGDSRAGPDMVDDHKEDGRPCRFKYLKHLRAHSSRLFRQDSWQQCPSASCILRQMRSAAQGY